MKKIDPTVLKETGYIAVFSLIFSLIFQAVFLLIGKWDQTVIFGNLLGYVTAVGNFFLMAFTVQSAVSKEDPKESKNIIKLSQNLRLLLLLGIGIIGYLLPVFNTIAVVVPFLFPRISVTLRSLFIKK